MTRTCVTLITPSGAGKISTPTAVGPMPTITVGSGDLTSPSLTPTTTGRRTATDIGPGLRLMGGRGLVMNPGVGHRITMVVGFTTIAIGPGVHIATTAHGEAGGGRRWLRSSPSISISDTIAGTP